MHRSGCAVSQGTVTGPHAHAVAQSCVSLGCTELHEVGMWVQSCQNEEKESIDLIIWGIHELFHTSPLRRQDGLGSGENLWQVGDSSHRNGNLSMPTAGCTGREVN